MRRALAVGRDNNMLEPAHLMAALLDQQGGSTVPLLAQAGVNVPVAAPAHRRDPRAAAGGQRAGRQHQCLQRSDAPAQRHRQARAAARRCSSSPANCSCSRRSTTRARSAQALKAAGATKANLEAAIEKMRGGEKVQSENAEDQRQALEKYTIDLTARAEKSQARSGHRPRRGNPPRDPGAAAAHQEQSGADRRTRRRQDRDRRRSRAAHRQRRSARRPARHAACCRSTWAR